MIRLFIPDFQVSSFLAFIENKSKENPPTIRSRSCLRPESYFTELNALSLSLYSGFVASGMPVNSAISSTLVRLKAGQFHLVNYDQLKSILTKQGAFRSK